jgi:hypothetical protein
VPRIAATLMYFNTFGGNKSVGERWIGGDKLGRSAKVWFDEG